MKKLYMIPLIVINVFASEIIEEKTNITKDKLSVEASISNFNSESNEYVFSQSDGRKISQLTWKAKNIKLLGIGVSYKTTENYELKFNIKRNISNDGLMDDYDWAYAPLPDTWTHWSHHENTDVNLVNIIDLALSKHFEYDDSTVSLSVGYKFEKQSFDAYDGDYIYSTYPILRGDIGTFSGLVISYEQTYKGFYVGLDLNHKYNNFNFLFDMRFSPIMNVKYTDTHYQRTPPFTDYTSFGKTSMISLGAGIEYNFNSNHSFSISGDYTKYSFKQGDRVRSYVTGYDWSLPNTVGVDSKNNLISLKYKYTF